MKRDFSFFHCPRIPLGMTWKSALSPGLKLMPFCRILGTKPRKGEEHFFHCLSPFHGPFLAPFINLCQKAEKAESILRKDNNNNRNKSTSPSKGGQAEAGMTQLPTTSSTTPLAAKCCCSTSRDPPADKPHSLNEQSGQKWRGRRKCHGEELEAVQITEEDQPRHLNPLERRASRLEKLLQQWLLLSALLTLFWPFNAVDAIRCYCTGL